jgi:hypothetical protein
MRPGDLGVVGVEEENDQTRARIFGHRTRFRDRLGLAALLPRREPPNLDVFECLDGLRRAVFEDLEIRGLQIAYGLAVDGREHVDTNEVRFDAKRGLRRGRLLLVASGRGS